MTPRPVRVAALIGLTGILASLVGCSEDPPKKKRVHVYPSMAATEAPAPTASASVGSFTKPPPNGDVDPKCTANGCLREVTKVGDYGLEKLAPYMGKGVRITNGYSVYTIRFATDGAESTGVVTIPFETAAPPNGWHIGGNDHGTIGVDDPCAPSKSLLGVGHAGWFGARGMIGVAPDYPGLGTDGVHPYLVAKSEGAAALDALRATRALAAHLGVKISGRFALVGLSQGGHATISAAAIHKAYAPDVDVRAFAAAAPASAWVSQWSKGASVNGWGIPIHAMLFYAWSKHYRWPADKPIWATSFAPDADRIFTTQCTYAPTGPTKRLRAKESLAVRAVGVSFHDRISSVAAVNHELVDVAFVRYNTLHRGAESEIFPHLEPRGATLLYSFKTLSGSPSRDRYRALDLEDGAWVPDPEDHYRYALTRHPLDGILLSFHDASHLRALERAIDAGPLAEDEAQYVADLGDVIAGRAKLE